MVTTAEAITTSGNVNCATITPTAYGKSVDRSELTQDNLSSYDMPLQSFVTDEATPAQVGAAAAGKLGIVRGTVGTDALVLQTTDQKANGAATSAKLLTTFELPPEYVDAETVQIAVTAAMNTTVADTSATVDIEAYPDDGDGTVSSDICQTSAQSINSLTSATKTFTLNAASLSAGDKVHVRLDVTINDAATGTAVIGEVHRVKLLADIKG